MRLSSKHNNQQIVQYSDFSGGLNTSVAQEAIAQNELAVCENMDLDTSTGLLKVVDGCKRILVPNNGTTFAAIIYDKINDKFLVIDNQKNIYITDLASDSPALTTLGILNGIYSPVYASWESGVLISSGGHIQYYNGTELKELTNSPAMSTFVYIKSGRVMSNDMTAGNESNLYFSSTGDEETWGDSSGDDSTGKWVEVGYKDGGKILAVIAMAQDVLAIKDNRCVYRLTGDYPDWSVLEVSRNIECVGRLAWHNDGENAYIMGRTEIQLLQSAAFYGDIKAQNIATKIANKLQSIAGNPRMIFLAALNQIWIPLDQRYVLIYDKTAQSFYMRRFNSEDIVDAVSVGDDVYIVRPSSICKLVSHLGYDDGEKMRWRFIAKRQVSHNDFLVKRAELNIMPYFDVIVEGNVKVGGVMIALPIPFVALRIWHNYSRIYHNRQPVMGANKRLFNLYDTGEEIYENFTPIYHNYMPIFHVSALTKMVRAVYRHKTITISGTGQGCCFTINNINFDVAEV